LETQTFYQKIRPCRPLPHKLQKGAETKARSCHGCRPRV